MDSHPYLVSLRDNSTAMTLLVGASSRAGAILIARDYLIDTHTMTDSWVSAASLDVQSIDLSYPSVVAVIGNDPRAGVLRTPYVSRSYFPVSKGILRGFCRRFFR